MTRTKAMHVARWWSGHGDALAQFAVDGVPTAEVVADAMAIIDGTAYAPELPLDDADRGALFALIAYVRDEHVCRMTYRQGMPVCQLCESCADALLDQECNLPGRPIGLDSELKRHLDGYER